MLVRAKWFKDLCINSVIVAMSCLVLSGLVIAHLNAGHENLASIPKSGQVFLEFPN